MIGNGEQETGNVELGMEKGEPEPGTESTSAEIWSFKKVRGSVTSVKSRGVLSHL